MLAVEYVACLVGICLLMQARAASRPPVITEMSNDTVYFKAGEPVLLACKAEGSPTPVYTWRKNNQPFHPSGTDDRWEEVPEEGALVSVDPRDSDSAIYQCLATNDHGTAVSVKINLVEAKLDPFPEDDPTYLRPHLGSPVTLPCVAPQSVPKAEVAWILRNQTGHFWEINYGVHITQDYTGSLRITDLQSKDGRNGSAYVCLAINDVAGQTSVSAPTFITPRGEEAPNTPVSLLWTSHTDTVAYVGEQVKMKCIFSGSPTPRLNWTRDGGVLSPTRSHVEGFGMELVIDNVQKEDEGDYECEGSNDFTTRPGRKAFRLTVLAKPQWTHAPDGFTACVGGVTAFTCSGSGIPRPDINLSINGTPILAKPQWTHAPDDVTACVGGIAAFTCSGSGTPRPNINLSINGTPVEELPASPRRNVNVTVNGDHASLNLSYANLTLSDTQVIQCNISNPHGYIFTNAYLNVIG